MEENAYSGIIEMMQSEGAKRNPPTMCIGEVVTGDPLSIKIGKLVLEKDDLFVSDILIKGYKREFNAKTTGALTSITQSTSGGSGESSFSSHSHSISANSTFDCNGTIEFKPYLKAGDLIALMPIEDGQKYIALCKVVSL